ncbi:hypothetical protein GCM10020219_069340 [Nonomuraea dietziae]
MPKVTSGPQQQEEDEQGDAEPYQPVPEERAGALAVVGAGGEEAGQQEEQAHEEGLVEHDQDVEGEPGGVLGGLDVVPDGDVAVGEGDVVQDDQHGENHAQVVDVGQALHRTALRKISTSSLAWASRSCSG